MARKYEKTHVICESHHLVESTHTLSLSEMRVLQLCLADIYQIEGVQADIFYRVPIQDYADMFNITYDAAYRALIDIVDSLMARHLTVRSDILDPEAPASSRTIIHWVKKIKYNPDESSIDMMWSKDIVFLIGKFEGKNYYSKYYLENTKKMQSIYSIRLYRLLNKWRIARGNKWEIAEFKRLMGLEEDSYSIFASLRRDVIEPAIKEINKYSDICAKVAYFPEKTGVKKTHVTIKYEEKKDGRT